MGGIVGISTDLHRFMSASFWRAVGWLSWLDRGLNPSSLFVKIPTLTPIFSFLPRVKPDPVPWFNPMIVSKNDPLLVGKNQDSHLFR
jgi:hypothetical protein